MLIQIIINSIIAYSYYSLIALGFLIIFRTVRFFHFAHAAVFSFGAYFTFMFNNWLGFPMGIAIPLAIVMCSILGSIMEFFVYRPLRLKNVTSMIFLLASLGMYIVLQNIISIIFGDDTKSIRSGVVRIGMNIFDARITTTQAVIVISSILVFIVVLLFVQYTKIGRALRAVSNDYELAEISGINSGRIVLFAFALGSALAGFAGILVSMDVDMTPTMGMNVLMMGIVVVLIGGMDSIGGVVLGALLLGFAQHFGIWKIGSQWQNSIAFVILLFFLLIRPQGFMGKKIKKATI